MALCHSLVQLLNLLKPHIPASFNMYLVINKWVTAVKFSKFSGHYVRNRSTLDKGSLGYIGTVKHKEHSPEVWHIPPGTPCIYTRCPRRNVPDFGRVFLMLNYTDITPNTYVQSRTVTEIMAREKCGRHRFRNTVRRPWRHNCPMRRPNYYTWWPWRVRYSAR